MRAPAVVPKCDVTFYGPGQLCLEAKAGDLVLTRSTGPIAWGIRRAEQVRVGKDYSWCNHAAIVVTDGPNAMISEEGSSGDVLRPLAELHLQLFCTVRFAMTATQRRDVVAFANWAALPGHGYGFLSITADAFNAVTGQELTFEFGNRMVCSTASTRALERCGLIPDRSPYAVTPGHLAKYADARVPTSLGSALAGAA